MPCDSASSVSAVCAGHKLVTGEIIHAKPTFSCGGTSSAEYLALYVASRTWCEDVPVLKAAADTSHYTQIRCRMVVYPILNLRL